MQIFERGAVGVELPGGSGFGPIADVFQPSSVVDGPRVTVTGHRTDSFGGFNGLMFQAMFEMPFGAGHKGDENHDHEQPIGPDDPLPSLPVNVELVVQGSDFFQSLPAEAQQALMSSPILVNQLATFLLSGGSIRFEDLSDGILGEFHQAWGEDDAVIMLSDQLRDSLNDGSAYRLERFLGAVAHELGHAMTNMEGFELDDASRHAFIESGYMNEAYAVVNGRFAVLSG